MISLGECLAEVASAAVDEGENILDGRALFAGEARTLEADDVEPGKPVEKVATTVMGHIFGDAAVALDDAVITDTNKLMKPGSAAQEAVVADVNMPGEEHAVGEHITVTELHVVCDMGVGHEEVIAAEAGDAAGLGAAMDGDLLANRVALADDELACRSRIERQILRVSTDDSSAADGAVRTHGGITKHLRVCFDFDSEPEFDRAFNDGIRTNADTGIKLRARVDEGGGMNHLRMPACRKLKYGCARVEEAWPMMT